MAHQFLATLTENLDPAQLDQLARRSDHDLAKRGLPGAFVYVALFIAMAGITEIDNDFPIAFFTGLGVAVVAGVGRVVLLQLFDSLHSRSQGIWRTLYNVCVLSTAAAWGILAGVAIDHYGIAWTTLFTIAITGGICGGALASLSMNFPLLAVYMLVMLGPSLAASLFVAGDQGKGLVFIFVTFTAYALAQGRQMHRYYWEALVNSVRLDSETQRRLHELTYHDSLTQLPNRTLFHDRLNQALLDARRTNRLVGVVSLNLDRFMNVNDTLGHDAGDAMLREVAARLAATVREGDTVARLAGDGFAFILPIPVDARDLVKVTQKIQASLAAPFEIRGLELFTTASLGIAVFPRDGTQSDVLLKNAEAAMTRVKSLGGNNVQYYEQEMNAQAMARLTLETRLRRALDRDEFLLHYQPKIDLATGRVCGVEALLRWQVSENETVPPDQFIPLLEETGLIVPVGEWVLRTACARSRAWMDEGFTSLSMAVNLSARQFREPGLASLVERILREERLAPNGLELEITESLLMDPSERTHDMLQRLHAMNLRLSIDDFGTGYSSLNYLRRLSIDSVKIDRAFVRDLHRNDNDATLVRAIIAMAHGLRLRVVAEGVEQVEHVRFLAAQHCDEIQGYWFSRPLPAEQLRGLLDRRIDPSLLTSHTTPDQPSPPLH